MDERERGEAIFRGLCRVAESWPQRDRRRRKLAWLVALLLILVPLSAWAIGVQDTYVAAHRPSNQGAPAVYRDNLAADDSATALAAISAQPTNGDALLVVTPRFSAAGATATVEVWLYHYRSNAATLVGISDVRTATASTLRRAGPAGDYLCNRPVTFDLLGAAVYDVRVRGVSSGTVDLIAWTAGQASAAAE